MSALQSRRDEGSNSFSGRQIALGRGRSDRQARSPKRYVSWRLVLATGPKSGGVPKLLGVILPRCMEKKFGASITSTDNSTAQDFETCHPAPAKLERAPAQLS